MTPSKPNFFKILSEKRSGLILLGILFLGVGLRVYRLDYQSFWNDELLSVGNIGIPFIHLITNPNDINIMPLFYFFIHPFQGLENHEFWLRFPPMVFGSLSILLFYFVSRNLVDKRTGILGALLFAISPFHIWYSQEARPYALLIMLSLLSILLLQRLLKNPGQFWLKISFIIVTTAVFYSHQLGIAIIGFEGIYLLLAARTRWKEWVMIFGLIGFLLIPGVYRMLLIPPTVSANSYYSFSPFAIAYTAWAFGTGYSLGPNTVELHMPDRVNLVFSYFLIIAPIMVLFAGVFATGAIRLYKREKTKFLFATLWLICPLVFAVFGALYTVHPFNVRYAILAFPAFVFILAVGIIGLNRRWLYVSALIFVCVTSFWSLKNYYFNEEFHRENNRAAGKFLTQHAEPDDLVIGSAAYTTKNLKYYYRGNLSLTFVGYPGEGNSNGEADSETPGAEFVNDMSLDVDLRNILADRNSFWLFLSRTFHSDPYQKIRNFCEMNFYRTASASWNGAELIRFETKLSKESTPEHSQ